MTEQRETDPLRVGVVIPADAEYAVAIVRAMMEQLEEHRRANSEMVQQVIELSTERRALIKGMQKLKARRDKWKKRCHRLAREGARRRMEDASASIRACYYPDKDQFPAPLSLEEQT